MKDTVFVQFVNQLLANVLLPIVLLALSAMATWVMSQLRTKLKSETSSVLLGQLDHLVELVVRELEQTMVKPFKEKADEGQLTKDEAGKILQQAKLQVMKLLGDKKSALNIAFGDVESTVVTMIEAKVHQLRERAPVQLSAIAENLNVEATAATIKEST